MASFKLLPLHHHTTKAKAKAKGFQSFNHLLSFPSSISTLEKKLFAQTILTTTHVGNYNGNLEEADSKKKQQQQVELTVLRFTLGIPGFDESYLPRWIGVISGCLILLNHFLNPDSVITPSQTRSEVLGICLALFSTTLPYLGKFLAAAGAQTLENSDLPTGNRQVFVMSPNLYEVQIEDLAWGSYVLLQNTNSMSVLIHVKDNVCLRGYWNIPAESSKEETIKWLVEQIEKIGLLDLKETLYFRESIGDELWDSLLPRGTMSLLVQPVYVDEKSSPSDIKRSLGFILLASSITYAFGDRERAWIKAIADKYGSKT